MQQNWELTQAISSYKNLKTWATNRSFQPVKSASRNLCDTRNRYEMLVTWRRRRLFHYSNFHHLERKEQTEQLWNRSPMNFGNSSPPKVSPTLKLPVALSLQSKQCKSMVKVEFCKAQQVPSTSRWVEPAHIPSLTYPKESTDPTELLQTCTAPTSL